MTKLRREHRGAVTRVSGTALSVMVGLTTVLGGAPSAAARSMPAAVPPAETLATESEAASATRGVAGAVNAVGGIAGAVGVHRLPPAGDAARDEQWQLKDFRAEALWRVSTGKGVTVAVIDSGVDGSHPDLAGQVLSGIDLVAEPGDGQTDPVGHGTTVAGLIAGRHDDNKGVVGLAPEAKILPVRVLDEENRYDDALIVAKGVRWAVENGAQVINLSLGGAGESPALAAALDYAFAKDVVVIACTGNASSSTGHRVWYPAREPGVIAVAGMERDSDALWSGSITGPETVLTAPATGLLGARPDNGFWRVQGTSFAAPLVSATAALVRARWPQLTAGDVVQRLISTARDLGAPGRDDRFGFGMVDPVRALNAEVPEVFRNPLDNGEPPPGVAGFGPAPGRERAESDAAAGTEGLGSGLTGRQTRWVVQPAGRAGTDNVERLWGLGVLLVLVVGGASVLTVWIRNRRGPWRPVPTGREFFESAARAGASATRAATRAGARVGARAGARGRFGARSDRPTSRRRTGGQPPGNGRANG